MLYILTYEKHFLKTISQWEFDYGFFTNLPRIIVTGDFPPSSFKLKEVSYLYCQNRFPNVKTTCHIKLKVFLWTKLLKSLLLAKYLISVAAASRTSAYLVPETYSKSRLFKHILLMSHTFQRNLKGFLKLHVLWLK